MVAVIKLLASRSRQNCATFQCEQWCPGELTQLRMLAIVKLPALSFCGLEACNLVMATIAPISGLYG